MFIGCSTESSKSGSGFHLGLLRIALDRYRDASTMQMHGGETRIKVNALGLRSLACRYTLDQDIESKRAM